MFLSIQNARRSRNRALIITSALGSVLLLGLGLKVTIPSRRLQPGKLVAVQEELVWKGISGNIPDTLAVGEFKLANTGGNPVRIVETISSCGCAKPTVSTAVVQPNAQTTVRVEALVQAVGEKVATVTLQTDSPLTPEVILKLRVISDRRPPFLVTAVGDITFRGDYSLDEPRQIVAVTLVPITEENREPIIWHQIPFLKVNPPIIDETVLAEKALRQVRYAYKVGLSSRPPEGLFSGEILVTDPWDANNLVRITVSLETPSPIRVIPSRLIVKRDGRDGTGEATFTVLSRLPMTKLSVMDQNSIKSPFTIILEDQGKDKRKFIYRLAILHSVPRDLDDRVIVIRPNGDSSKELTLPVRFIMQEHQ